jgi:hypothetical protein
MKNKLIFVSGVGEGQTQLISAVAMLLSGGMVWFRVRAHCRPDVTRDDPPGGVPHGRADDVEGCSGGKGTLKRREICGTALLVAAALGAWADHAVYEAYRAAAREDLLLYIGMPADSISSWFRIAALLSGGAGLSLLLPAVIGRIPRKVPRASSDGPRAWRPLRPCRTSA